MLRLGTNIGLSVTSALYSKKSAGDFIAMPQNSIRLLFPNLDFNFSYKKDYDLLLKNFD